MRIWRVASARNAVFFHSSVASLAQLLRTGAEDRLLKMRQNLHHACAGARFGSQNR